MILISEASEQYYYQTLESSHKSALESLKKLDFLIAATLDRINRESVQSPEHFRALCEALKALTDARNGLSR